MEHTARIFCCASCQDQAIICSCCDRGNIYCKTCAPLARAKSKKERAKRYQSTKKGKHKHAARQAAYIKRKKTKMTHPGYKDCISYDLLPTEPNVATIITNNSVATTKKNVICDFCYNQCNYFVRTRFLQHYQNKLWKT